MTDDEIKRLCDEATPTVTVYLGDDAWHDGPGFYYVIDDYIDEGSCGHFDTREECEGHARADGYVVSNAGGQPARFPEAVKIGGVEV